MQVKPWMGVFTAAWLSLIGPVRSSEAAPASRAAGELPWIMVDAHGRAPSRGPGGVGMVLKAIKGGVVVERVVPGGPAGRAGVQIGDRVVAVDHKAAPADVSQVARLIRGEVGTKVALQLARGGRRLNLTAARVTLDRLMPPLSDRPLVLREGTRLVRVGARWRVALDIMASSGGLQGYLWHLWPVGEPYGGASTRRGRGLLVTHRVNHLDVGDMRLVVGPWKERDVLIVRSSQGPLSIAPPGDLKKIALEALQPVRPRQPPRPYRKVWRSGSCALHVRFLNDGEPLAGRRVTLNLTSASGVTQPTRTVVTDADGTARWSVPTGPWKSVALWPSLSGGGQDLWFTHRMATPTPVRCGPTAVTARMRKLSHSAWPAAALTRAIEHKLVGSQFPRVPLKAWIGGATPKITSLKGKVALIYFWATWCGPCKRVSPVVAELRERLKEEGLLLLPLSVDADRFALEEAMAMSPEGGAPVGWLGPSDITRLGLRGLPTLMAVDDRGVVRAVHAGTGVSLTMWGELLGELLRQAKGAPRRGLFDALVPQPARVHKPGAVKRGADKSSQHPGAIEGQVREPARSSKGSAPTSGGASPRRRVLKRAAREPTRARGANAPADRPKREVKKLPGARGAASKRARRPQRRRDLARRPPRSKGSIKKRRPRRRKHTR